MRKLSFFTFEAIRSITMMKMWFKYLTFVLLCTVVAKTNTKSNNQNDKAKSIGSEEIHQNSSKYLQIQVDLLEFGDDEIVDSLATPGELTAKQLDKLYDTLKKTNRSKVKLSVHNQTVKTYSFQLANPLNYGLQILETVYSIIYIPKQIKRCWNYLATQIAANVAASRKEERNKHDKDLINKARVDGQEGHIYFSYRPTLRFAKDYVVDHELISEILAKRIDKISENMDNIFYRPRGYRCFVILRDNKLTGDSWVGTVVFGGDSGVYSGGCAEIVIAAYNIETKSLVWRKSGKPL